MKKQKIRSLVHFFLTMQRNDGTYICKNVGKPPCDYQILCDFQGNTLISEEKKCKVIYLPTEGISIIKTVVKAKPDELRKRGISPQKSIAFGAIKVDGSEDYVVKPQLSPDIDILFEYHNGFFVYLTPDDKLGYINSEGKFVGEKYDSATYFSKDGVGVISKNNQLGYIDQNGDEHFFNRKYNIDKVGYTLPHGFNNGGLIVVYDNKWGVIDKEENWIINPIYLEKEIMVKHNKRHPVFINET